MPNSNTINKAPPFLELSRATLENIDTTGLDIENVLSVWTGLTKCSGFIKNGKRLENISWRIVNRQLVNNRQETRQSPEEQQRSNSSGTRRAFVPSTSLGKSTAKLNDGDLFSLLSIVSEETVDPQRPPLMKRKSSSRSNLFLNKKSSESLVQRPPLFRKSSSSKSLKKLNQKNRRSNADLPSMTPSVPRAHDTDLFEQPHPRYAFGIYDQETKEGGEDDEEENGVDTKMVRPPALKRSDTSTSVIRGFSPEKPSAVSTEVQVLVQTPAPVQPPVKEKVPTSESSVPPTHTPSLFGNGKPARESKKPSPTNGQQPKPVSLFPQQSRSQSGNRSCSSDRMKSPLSNETTSEILKGKSTSSLFGQKPTSNTKPKTVSLFGHLNHAVPSHAQSSGAIKSMLFEQVGISPNLKKSVTPPPPHLKPSSNSSSSQVNSQKPTEEIHSKKNDEDDQQQQESPHPSTQTNGHDDHASVYSLKKRTNVLSNLGMTSLTRKEQKKEKDKNMFFIESSPSPTDVPKYIDTHSSNVSTSPEVVNHQAPAEPHHHRHRPHKNPARSIASSSKSPPPPTRKSGSHSEAANVSLFRDKIPVREIMFSSDDSLSEESDWSSVSEDLESDDEEDARRFHEQWVRTTFQRDETVAKPQIKRSLLSGLFLNEMHPDHHSKTSAPATSSAVYAAPASLGTKQSSSDVQDLSSSLSSTHIQVKQRLASCASNDKAPLELTTSEPHAEISTSNVNVPGLVNEPHRESATLKEKLESTQEASHTPLSSSFSQIAKSALNLTNYFSHQRKNSFSSIASDRTRVRFKHESNAPPTASTLLPTALSTHMFLPNAHQRAKSRLASVVETESSSGPPSNEASRKNSTTAKPMHSDSPVVVKPIKSPTVPIQSHRIKVGLQDDEPVVEHQHSGRSLSNYNNISRKLSPKTTRKQMLATELSDSLRKSILWDRQYCMYPAGEKVKVDEEVVIDEETGEKKTVKAPKVIKPELEKHDDDEWEKESFYARGW